MAAPKARSAARSPAVRAPSPSTRYRKREGFALRVDDATSARMARTRQSGTAPELVVRQALRQLGHRYRVANRDLPGSPDLANRRRRWAIFVHGCFWHRHGCKATTTPSNNREFWEAKFARNEARDARVARELRAEGFVVIVVWECDTKRGAEHVSHLLRQALPAQRGGSPRLR